MAPTRSGSTENCCAQKLLDYGFEFEVREGELLPLNHPPPDDLVDGTLTNRDGGHCGPSGARCQQLSTSGETINDDGRTCPTSLVVILSRDRPKQRRL